MDIYTLKAITLTMPHIDEHETMVKHPDEKRLQMQLGQQHQTQLVWFSYLQSEYQVLDLWLKKVFKWKKGQDLKRWDWDNCSVTRAKVLPNSEVRIVIRSKTNRNSDYMGKIPVQLRFMLGIDIKSISEPFPDIYSLRTSDRKNLPESAKDPHERWVFQLNDRYWIWEWAKAKANIESSQVYRLYEDIRDFLKESREGANVIQNKRNNEHHLPNQNRIDNTQTPESHRTVKGTNSNIFRVSLDEKINEFIPVIYQPAVDSLKNFVRQVHCAKTINSDSSVDVEVSLVFNNEALRRHRILNQLYEKIRLFLYGRTADIETFKIHLVKSDPRDHENSTKHILADTDNNIDNNDYFVFYGIYSGNHGIEEDTIHLDKDLNPTPRHVQYYFVNRYHPIIFINTANHAMGEHDSNPDIWKWEYIPWIKKAPIKFGVKTRKEIDSMYTPFSLRNYWQGNF
jgi:hypothetical protein